MGKIVGAFGVPHTPRAPQVAEEDTPRGAELVRLYGEVAARITASGPDVLVMLSTDHFNTFFRDLPIFCIGVADESYGPCDHVDLPSYRVDIDAVLGKQLQHHAVRSEFDVAVSHEFALDHTFMVPYHFLARQLGVTIVPVFINGLVAPTPSSKRCRALGETIREAIELSPDDKRVAIVASGSFSLDLGGLHDQEVPDPQWVDEVITMMTAAKRDELVDGATDDRMARAGNIGGELLNWIAMLGTFDPQPPAFLEGQVGAGHAYGAWALDGSRR